MSNDNKNTPNALDRLTKAEFSVGQLVGAVSQLQMQSSTLLEVLDALVELEGVDRVQEAVLKARKEKAEKKAEGDRAALDQLLLNGLLVQADKIEDGSVIVAKETGPDGTVKHPGQIIAPFRNIADQFKEKILGQAVGFKLDLPDGVFEVLEVYGPNPNPPKPEGVTKPPEAQ
jgi:hypothetical protein